MATNMGTLADLATNQAYTNPAQLYTGSNFSVNGTTFTTTSVSGDAYSKGGYSGQLLKSTSSNEYYLLDRGSTDFWSNWVATDFFGITLGTVGLGVVTYQMQSAQNYAKDQFAALANKIKAGEVIDTLNLVGHSSGYAQAVMQYETLLSIIADPQTDATLLPYYTQLKSKVQIFGVNGAGVPTSNMAAGSLDGKATNLVLPGDSVDDAGIQFGTKISLNGAGLGYGSVVLGGLLGLAASTPYGAILYAVIAGMAGNHPGGNTDTYMGKFPGFADLTSDQWKNYTPDQQNALRSVDPLSWQAMSELDKALLRSNPTLTIANWTAQGGLTPSTTTSEAGGTRYTYSNGVSYLFQTSGNTKSYVVRQGTVDTVRMDVDPVSTAYHYPDGSSNILYITGQTLWTLPDSSTLYMQADGSGQLQVNGRQFDLKPGEVPFNNAGTWSIKSQSTQGSLTRLIGSNGDSKSYEHDSLNQIDTITTQLGGEVIQTLYNSETNTFVYSVNNVLAYSAIIERDPNTGYTGTVRATVDGKDVVFNATFTSDNTSDPSSIVLTGIATINGLPAENSDAVNNGLTGTGFTELLGNGQVVRQAVAAADPHPKSAQDQIVKPTSPLVSADIKKWFNEHGAQLTQGLNGLGALIQSLDSHSLTDKIHGTVWLSTAISSYIDPRSTSSKDLGMVGQYVGYLDAARNFRTGLKSGDSHAIQVAVASMTATVLGVYKQIALDQAANLMTLAENASSMGLTAEAQNLVNQSIEANTTANLLGDAIQTITVILSVDNAVHAFERGQYLDAVMDIVGIFFPPLKAVYDFAKIGINYANTHHNDLSNILHFALQGTSTLINIATKVLNWIFGTPNPYAWGNFYNDVNGIAHGTISLAHDGGDQQLNQLHASLLSSLQNVIDKSNAAEVKRAASLGEAPTEMGILGSRLLYTRLEIKNGNYFSLYDVKTGGDSGTVFNLDGNQRYDTATSDKFGQNFIEVFVRNAFNNNAVIPMWNIKTIVAQGADLTAQQRYTPQGAWLATDAGKSTDGHAGQVLWQSAMSNTLFWQTNSPNFGGLNVNSIYTPAQNTLAIDSRGNPTTKFTNVLNVGDVLKSGESITSSNGRFLLRMQTDGNLVLLDQRRGTGSTQIIWLTGILGAGNYLKIINTGALVLYSSANTVLWTAPNSVGGKSLTLQDNGLLSLTDQVDNQSTRVIAIDLNGDGQIVKSTKADGVLYDIDSDGYAEAMEWIGPKDGMLVLDRNGDGQVKGGHELFYDSQVNMAAVGLNVLKEIDSNNDNKITSTDFVFNYLEVWQDINRDGVIQAKELKHLADWSISQIDFSSTNINLGSVTMNGVSRAMVSQTLEADATGFATSMVGNSLFVEQEGTGKTSVMAMASQDLGSVGTTAVRATHIHSQTVGSNTMTVADDRIDAQQGMSVSVLASQLLSNDKGNGSVANLKITNVYAPIHGVVSFDVASGRITFTADVGFANYDRAAPVYGQFSYDVSDTVTGLTSTSIVTVDVSPSTQLYMSYASQDPVGTVIGGIAYHSPHVGNLSVVNTYDTTNTHAPVGLQYTLLSAPHFGTLYLNEKTGAWSYNSTAVNETRQDAFTATVQDAAGNSTQQKVYINNFANADTYRNIGDGAGNSILNLNYSLERITTDAGGIDTVFATVDALLATTAMENVVLLGSTAIDAQTNGASNLLFGNQAANRLDGGAGDDVMVGGAGDDVYIVDSAGDHVIEYADTDTMASLQATNATVLAAGNVFPPSFFNLAGHSGFAPAVNVIGSVVPHAWGQDRVESSIDYTLGANVEDLTLTGTTAIVATGNALDNVIKGNSANNWIDGGVGVDTLMGGAGNDTYIVDNVKDVVVEYFDEGVDAVISRVDYTLQANVENLTLLAGTTAIRATGNALDNLITGNEGNNFIVGGAGADTMIGGLGNDTYVVDFASDVVTENANEGIDTIQSSVTYTLGANVENLTLIGTAAINGTSSDMYSSIVPAINNVLTGNTASNVLSGGGGDDTYVFNRGGGSDTINDSYFAPDPTNTWASWGKGFSFININGGLDTLRFGYGVSLADLEVEKSGTDLVIGLRESNQPGLGASQLSDRVTLQGFDDLNRRVETIAFADGTSIATSNWVAGGSSADSLSAGVGSASLWGGGGNDILTGSALSDRLDGGIGADYMVGGAGDDTYVVDNVVDWINENQGGGIDTVQTSVTYSLALMPNVENLTLTGTAAIDGTGNDSNNVITGNAAANTLSGGAGDDTYQLSLGGGADTIVDSSGNDQIVFGTNILASRVKATRANGVVKLAVSPTDSVSFVETAPGQFAVENVVFANGTVWNSAMLNLMLDSLPTGSVTITGNATQSQTLTATNTLADADGMGAISYRWYANGVDIVGAYASTLTLTEAQVGKAIVVTASYTDLRGTSQSIASAATAAVVNVNDAPTGVVTITGNATQNQILSVSNTVADADGIGADAHYQWRANNVDIAGANAATLVLGEAQVGKTITAAVIYTDLHGTVENVSSAVTTAIANVNDAPTGTVLITGTATQNQTLTATNTLADLDGLGAISYQWQANGVNIVGATANTLTLAEAQVGKTITVSASYTDGHGTAENISSTATAAVLNVNDAPTGAVVISGNATQNQILTVTNTLADLDGLGVISYQWKANGVNIAGATAGTYTLTAGEVGKTITVAASYTDGHGTAEIVSSAATNTVAAIINSLPTGTVTITGTATQNQTLTATNNVADANGLGTISYQWKANGVNIAGATAATFTLTEAQVGKAITVSANYTDLLGTAESVLSAATAAVVNVNDAPTGAVTIAGTATQNQVLTATNTLADLDGLGVIGYQWKANGVNIVGATANTLTLAEAQVGKTITVSASYTDGHGTAESVTSAATVAVVNVNDAPTGSVTISGTATQNQILTAANTLADLDGLGVISYQWKANGVNIVGATANTFTLTEAQVGTTITVTASYTDLHGTAESVLSAATTSVVNVNDAPTGVVTITGTATQNQVLTATNTLADLDGLGVIGYQWKANGVNIVGATANTLTLAEAQVGKTITVSASYTDLHGTAESVSSAATTAVVNVNDAPTGAVTITGTATQNQILVANNTLADLDGLGVISYQWKANGVNIVGATTSILTLAEAQVGKTITVAASYTDGHGTVESVLSAATVAVVNVNDAPTGAVTITGTATQNQILTAANTLADADGLGVISYQWQANGANIVGATAGTYTLTAGEVGKTITVAASYTDGHGTAEFVSSAATRAVAPSINSAPTGSVTISGTAAQNQILTATNTLADLDGLGVISYQWKANGVDIAGATSNTFTLVEAQVGQFITVTANYTDLLGTAETVLSAATVAVANVNDAPTGIVTITGNATQNQILTAANTLADADGMGAISYQWKANGVDIAGATAATLTLAEALVGKAITVAANYTDLRGTVESVLSAATVPVGNINDTPTGIVTITGNATQNQILTATNTLADLDGLGIISYQWKANGVNIVGATANTFALTEAQVGQVITVAASYIDGHGTAESVTSASTVAVVNVNDAPTGTVTITGTVTQNQILTAANTLADLDGLGVISYQWKANGVNIAGATAGTYTLTAGDVGKAITVTAGYTDGHGTAELVSSAATAVVVAIAGLTINGTAANDILIGTAGGDTINGGAGADTMTGGLGSDTYVVDNILDVVVEQLNEGTDLVQSSVTYTLAANVENLTLTGTTAINGTGNTLDNILDGSLNTAVNTLTGGTGNDTYIVGTGDIVSETSTVLTEIDTVQTSITYTLGANVENLTLTGTTAINGTGNTLDNILNGSLNTAVNTLAGGTGNDTYIVGVGDIVSETSTVATEIDTVQTAITYALTANVENLTLTGTAAVNGTGNTANNVLTGNSAANTLDGGAGADTMIGGLGNDTYVVDNIGDIVTETSALATEVDVVQSSVTYTLSANVENLTLTGTTAINGTGNASNNVLTGNTAANTLTGGAGNDTLNGGTGADTLIGGLGNDTYVVDNIADITTELLNEGTDLVQSSVTYTLAANVENLTLTGTTAINGTGNALDNILDGSLDTAVNTLTGSTGNDTYIVGTGDIVSETSTVATEIDSVQTAITYTLTANVENLTLTGTAAVNGTGNTLNNILDGSLNTAVNTLAGGTGNDTYIVGTGDIVSETSTLATEIDTVQTAISYTLTTNVENLILTGTAAVNGTGNASNNVLTGNSAANTLSGGAGADTMIGGLGNDTYVVDNIGDIVTETSALATEIDSVQSSITYALGANVENLTLTGAAIINGTGNELNNTLTGNTAANVLDGGVGADTMIGGLGNDTYMVDNIGDIVTEISTLATEIDSVQASVTYTLGANVENLTLTGMLAIDGTGNALNNTITGNASDNILNGGAGADTLTGGLGSDTYVVDNAGDVVIETSTLATEIDYVESSVTYTLGANVENLYLTGTAAINGTGNTLNNELAGTVAANVLDGGAGDDWINGGAGADTMIGGTGNDHYFVDNIGDIIIETSTLTTENDVVESTVTYTLSANVEDLYLMGTAAINGTGNDSENLLVGNDAANVLDGGAGRDWIYGGAGADTMIGGTGNDTYYVDNVGDIIIETSTLATENDVVQSTVSYVLSANVEDLYLMGTAAINGTGNSSSNFLRGNDAANILSGGDGNDYISGAGGADTMIGGSGNDTYYVDNIGDTIIETSTLASENDVVQSTVTYTLSANVEDLYLMGTDAINGTGNASSNFLRGNDVANILDGGDGNDWISGAGGADTMIGGLGNDTYYVDNVGDVVIETSTLASENDVVNSEVTYTLSANVEDLYLTGTAMINGTGNASSNFLRGNDAANVLSGGDGNDWISGAGGADIMIGGTGNDTYYVDNVDDVVIETSTIAGENDVVRSDVTYTLSANVEDLYLTGTLATNGTGNDSSNTLVGNDAANVLDGGADRDWIDGGLGADTMIGGTGNDTYYVDNVGDVIIETSTIVGENDVVQSMVTYTLSANVEDLYLMGTAAINGTGNASSNFLRGNDVANTLDGGDGNDWISGAGGADTMIGGTGNDTYYVDNIGDVVIETSTIVGENDVVNSEVTYTLSTNVEDLNLTGTAAINGTGNASRNSLLGNDAANVLDGGDGGDWIDGGLGADVLIGGAGNDVYYVDNIGDVIIETTVSTAEIDTVQSTATAFTLSANVDDLNLLGTADINGAGNELNNDITGNIGNNLINGGLGDDILVGDAGNDVLEGAGGNDTLSDTAGNNLLNGGAGIDTMTGNTGNELYIGGLGNDTITTGTGADIIAFNKGDGVDTVVASTGADNIISLGGGINYAGLTMSKSGTNLILNTGNSEQVILQNWYSATTNHSVAKLQVVLDNTTYNAASTDPLLNQRIHSFDFALLAQNFDAALVANPALSAWALSNALLTAHLSASNTAALGGDLAYQYSLNGTLAGIGLAAAQTELANAGFGTAAQTLQPLATLQTGTARLG